jgi:Tfp pilus assembly protein PilX
MSKRLRQEEGIALVVALGITVVLIIFVASMVVYVTGGLSASNTSKARVSASDLAEAGVNAAISKLASQLDSSGAIVGTDPRTATLLPSTTLSFASQNGSVTYSGTIDASYVWTIKATGSVKVGTQTQTHNVTRMVSVSGINDGANSSSWSRFYQDSAGTCLTIDTMTFVTNVATRGNLCIVNTGGITGAAANVDVGGTVTITGPLASSGVRSPTIGAGWTSPTNVYTSNSVYATNVMAAGATGANQDTTGFGFAIPPGAKILGVTAPVQRLSSACCNAVQTISESPGGSSTTSVAIAYNASAATVQAALVTIYGSGNVVCASGPLPAGVVCTFQGAHAAKPVILMSLSSKSLTGGASPAPVFTNTTVGSTGALQDANVQLLKAGAPVGSNKAVVGSTWGTASSTITYGAANDLWGTTWTAANLNASNFGLRFAAKNVAAASATASIDYVSVTVTYNDDTNGIGASGSPVNEANIGGTCTYNGAAAHQPCTSADHVWASNITNTAAASNPALSMPQVDFAYWWANAMPGPKHFCTNPSPGLATNFFDNDSASTTGPNKSITVNGEMAPNNADYTCQVWSQPPTSGTLLGELSWNHTTHILTIQGTIFVDGNFRFDEDGEVIHYFGRADIMSSRDDEIDALVCAGGSGTTYATSCLNDMTNWDMNANMMVLMSQMDNEYDQGGTTCSGNTHPGCWNGHLPGGFQGIMYSTADCLIHQNFQDSGPVICNTITLPNEGGINPTFFTFPSVGNLTDGQTFSNTATSTHFQLDVGAQTG